MDDLFNRESLTPFEAKHAAQRLAFGPFAFQAARALRDLGILEALRAKRDRGATPAELAEELDVSRYGLEVLLEAGLASEIVRLDGERYSLTNTGVFVLRDKMTRINMDFVADVCYRGMSHLEEAVREGRPAGLSELGDWPTIYRALAELPEPARGSWFAFDHFYSDGIFPAVLPRVFERPPRRLLDVGGNTGRFAVSCAEHDADVRVTILDLPGQLEAARAHAAERGFADRIDGEPIDFLDRDRPFPEGYDAIWMSQFLDCFAEDEIVSILERARRVMEPETRLYIVDTYWDRQRHPAAAFCLIMTSLYFTCMANGSSKMYHSARMLACIERAGLEVVEQVDEIGISHPLFVCRRPGE